MIRCLYPYSLTHPTGCLSNFPSFGLTPRFHADRFQGVAKKRLQDKLALDFVEVENEETHIGWIMDHQFGFATSYLANQITNLATPQAHISDIDKISCNAAVTLNYIHSQGCYDSFIFLNLTEDIFLTSSAQFLIVKRLCLPEDKADVLFVFLECCDVRTRKLTNIRNIICLHRDFNIYDVVVRRDNIMNPSFFIISKQISGSFEFREGFAGLIGTD